MYGKMEQNLYGLYLPAICSLSLSVCVCVCPTFSYMYSNVLKMINFSIWPTMGLGIDRVPFTPLVCLCCIYLRYFIFYFVRFNRGFYLFSCYLFNLMEQKTIAFIGKRFCHAHIDFIAKSEQILRLFGVSFSR